MPDDIDWSETTFEGNRLRQHREFLALPLRRKLEIIEQMGEVAAHFAKKRKGIATQKSTPEPHNSPIPEGQPRPDSGS